MSEETPLVRQWILLRKLSALHHGATVKEMADEMRVSEKTIRRDLELFQRAGFPLVPFLGDLADEFGGSTTIIHRQKCTALCLDTQ